MYTFADDEYERLTQKATLHLRYRETWGGVVGWAGSERLLVADAMKGEIDCLSPMLLLCRCCSEEAHFIAVEPRVAPRPVGSGVVWESSMLATSCLELFWLLPSRPKQGPDQQYRRNELYLLQLIPERGWISCLVSRVP